ncbi:MAG: hypothetical protein OXI60_02715 [Acidiferrobacterales bacterium]|nr:hypothetical protein [Acidiferrobacterales bacterium]
MARVQLIIRDEDRSRYIHQARKEGLTLSAWLRAAADERLDRNSGVTPFESPADIEEFFTKCDNLDSNGTEPDWEQHLLVIHETRNRGMTNT